MSGRSITAGSTRSVGNQIEFLPPNDAAFGMADVADFVGFDGADTQMFGDEGPRSKWLPAAATVVVLALLGGGIVAAAPWDDTGDAAPTPSTTIAPTTSAVATTGQAPTTTDRVLGIDEVGPAGYVLDDSGAFQLAGAWTAGVEYRPPETYADDRFDLWTSEGATRTSGQWLAVTTNKGRGDYEEALPNGTRVVVGHGIGVVSTTTDGVSRMLFTASDHTPFEIGGFGLGLAELLTVAAQVAAGPDDTIDYGTLLDGILAGLTPTVSAHIPNGGLNPFLLMAQAQTGVYYIDPETGAAVDVTVNRPTEMDAAVLDFLFQPVTGLSTDEQAQLDALTQAGRRFRLSTLPDWPGTLLATSMQPGDELMLDTIGSQSDGSITVWGNNVSTSTMIGMLSQIRLARDDEWVDVIDRSNRGLLDVGSINGPISAVIGSTYEADPEADISSDQTMYQMEMTDGHPPYIYVSTQNNGWGAPMPEVLEAPTVQRYASSSFTYLVATVRRPSPIRRIRVTLEGMPSVDIEMAHVGETIDAAGFAYSEMVPITVEFLDENGNVVTVA